MNVTDSANTTNWAVTDLHKQPHGSGRTIQRSLLVVASVFGIASGAVAGSNTWTALGPSGGAVYDLAFHPTEAATMYAATSAGFYRSNDSGSSWQRTSADGLGLYFNPRSLAVDPSRPDRVYIGSGPGFALLSVDRGVTLQVTNGYVPTGGGPIVAAADGSAIYFVVEGDVYRSTDGGASRQRRGNPFDGLIYTLRVDPTNSEIVYASNYFDGVRRSTDGGANWTTIYTPTGSDRVWTMTIDPQNANRFWLGTEGAVRVSEDAGLTWQTVLPSTGYDIDVDPRDGQIVYVATDFDSIVRTTDGGTTWAPMTLPAKSEVLGQRRLTIHSADSDRLYLYGADILESLDGGTTWVRKDDNIIATTPRRFSPTATASGHYFVPVVGHGVVGLRPGDDQLEYQLTPRGPGAGGLIPDVTAVLSLPTRLVAAFSDSRVAISSDLGATWTMASTEPARPIHSMAAADQGATLYAATDAGVYRSEDFGQNWLLSVNGLPVDANVGHIAVAADQTTVYASVATGTAAQSVIYRSVDSGQNWSLTPTVLEKRAASALAVHPTDPQTLMVGTNEGAFKTTDGGSTWQTMELHPGVLDSPVSAMAFDPTNPSIIYFDQLSTSGHMHRSVDGGATFQKITPDYYEGGGAFSLLLSPDQPYRVLAAVEGGGVRDMSIMPDLQSSVRVDSGNVTPNSLAGFTITATNRGPFDATDVVVEARLPANVTGTSATGSATTCDGTNELVRCRIGVLRTNQSLTIRLLTTPTTIGSLVAQVNVSGAQPDVVTGNNSTSAAVVISAASTNTGSSGGGGGRFDVATLFGLISLGLLRRRRRLYE